MHLHLTFNLSFSYCFHLLYPHMMALLTRSFYLFIFLFPLFACLSFCLFVCLSVCLFVCLSVRLFVYFPYLTWAFASICIEEGNCKQKFTRGKKQKLPEQQVILFLKPLLSWTTQKVIQKVAFNAFGPTKQVLFLLVQLLMSFLWNNWVKKTFTQWMTEKKWLPTSNISLNYFGKHNSWLSNL